MTIGRSIMQETHTSHHPDPAVLAEMTQRAEEIVRERQLQMGYPFDQDLGLEGYGQWLVDTDLINTTLINVGDPWKENWPMLHTDVFERRVIGFFAKAFGFGEDHWGVISNGGTDGNMHGVYFGRKALAAQSDIPPILYVSEEAHYSVQKLGDVQNIDVRIIRALPDGQMDVADFERQLDPTRPALIAIAIGGTFKGAIDDQDAIDAVIQKVKPIAVYRHLDVALFGGYLPWLNDPEAKAIIDAKQHTFDSVALSGHKFVGVNEPAGLFICHKATMEAVSSVRIPYLNCNMPTISCSRSGFDALKLYWKISQVKPEGFQAQADHALAMAQLLKSKLEARGQWVLLNPFSTTVIFKRPSPSTVFHYCMACCDDAHYGALSHVVVMQYFSPALIDQLVDAIAPLADKGDQV